MHTSDLIELAAMDALGLLDAEEQAAYDRAFHAASPELKRQIRAEQARAAAFEASLLPQVEPSAELRERVMNAFAEAKALQEASGVRAVVHRPGRVVPKVRPSRRVSPMWRAAAIGLSVAVLVLGAVGFWLQDQNQKMGDQVVVNKYVGVIGMRQLHDTLFDRNTQRLIFAATAEAPADFAASAVVITNPDWKQARFFCSDLIGPKGAPADFMLCIINEANEIVDTIEQFTSEGRLKSFDVASKLTSGMKLAIFSMTPDHRPGAMLMVTSVIG